MSKTKSEAGYRFAGVLDIWHLTHAMCENIPYEVNNVIFLKRFAHLVGALFAVILVSR